MMQYLLCFINTIYEKVRFLSHTTDVSLCYRLEYQVIVLTTFKFNILKLTHFSNYQDMFMATTCKMQIQLVKAVVINCFDRYVLA
jgi:hypothetical protein